MTHRFCQLFLEDHLASWGLQRLHFFNPNDGNGSIPDGRVQALDLPVLTPPAGLGFH